MGLSDLQERAREHVQGNDAVAGVGRAGLVARGVLHVVVGLLAVQIAFGRAAQEADAKGALEAVTDRAYGTFLVSVAGVGFVLYAIWRFIAAVADPKEDGADWKGIAKRAGQFGRGLLYVGLAIIAFRFAFNGSSSTSSSDEQKQELARHMLGIPGGRFIVMAAGLVVIGTGIWNAYNGLTRRFASNLDGGKLRGNERVVVLALGTAGFAGRAAAFLIVGGFVVRAGWRHDPNTGLGLDDALRQAAQSTVGPWLLTAVAAGLIAYGAFMFASAVYGRVVSD